MGDAAAQTAAVICAALNEFYGSGVNSNPERYIQLDRFLSDLHKSKEGFDAALLLLHNEQANVQLFSACLLYDSIRKRWDDLVVSQETADRLKLILINKLTDGAHFQNQSITNKLSSLLALLALHCIPDLWPEPIHDLTIHWAQQPELLLRVLAELAAEFPRIILPLSQRSNLKSVLLKSASDIIKVIDVVLHLENVQPSLKNAAIECVGQWLSLPAINLLEWQGVLVSVFTAASSDLGATARILTSITCCENLSVLDNFAYDFGTFIVRTICEPLRIQAENLRLENKFDDNSELDMEELAAIITAVADFASATLKQLLKICFQRNDLSLISSICSFLCIYSTWPGRYPIEETVSEGPEVFWNSLKEEIDYLNDEEKPKLLSICRSHYAALLQSAVGKIAYPSNNELQTNYDKEQLEKFDMYRAMRVEIAMHAFFIIGQETCVFLCQQLRGAILTKSLSSIESVLFLFGRIADYLTEDEGPYIRDVIENCLVMKNFCVGDDREQTVLGNSLMNLLYAFSHLIFCASDANILEEKCFDLIFSFLQNINVADECLKTLRKFAEERSPSLFKCSDIVYNKCYEIFCNTSVPQRLRLAAVKCVGYALSVKDQTYVLNKLDEILAPRVQKLQMVLDERSSNDGSSEALEQECLFELGVFTMLVTSLAPKSDEMSLNFVETPSFRLMQHCMPLFRGLVLKYSSSPVLVNKVFEVLRASLSCMKENMTPLLGTFYEIIDVALLIQPEYPCSLAKTFTNNKIKTELCAKLRIWYDMIRNSCSNEISGKYIDLAYHVVKKNWKMLKENQQESIPLLRTLLELNVKVLMSSQDSSLACRSAIVLSTMLRNFVEDEIFLDLMQEIAQPILSVTFSRLQVEMIRSVISSLAEILMYYTRKYPLETRQYLSALPHGHEILDCLKEAFMPKNFKHMVALFNSTMRQKGVVS